MAIADDYFESRLKKLKSDNPDAVISTEDLEIGFDWALDYISEQIGTWR